MRHGSGFSAASESPPAASTLLELFKECPIEDANLLSNLELFTGRIELQNTLFFDHIYKQILGVHGVLMEFGTRYGHNLALLTELRGIYEPYVRSRKIIGFDSFEGFLSVDPKDGKNLSVGRFATSRGYDKYLERVLTSHESLSPISHIRKFEIVSGDAATMLEKYLEAHPETIVAFAHFDLDLYKPTKACLEILSNYITKGTIIGFDQLCLETCPGETIAFREVLGLSKYNIRRTPYSSSAAYIIVD
ncbi:MAG: crotonobetainyl-CoA--carnitine CoA-transferase [Dehalococcoidia bacterium]|jgi:hypothetical protein|nr:crotonobetainyl-CoA--carnitine CoA-transferase [Dehalococcoidia bacterium]